MSVPHLNQLITIQMTGNRRIAAQIRQMNQNFDRLGRTVERISNQIQRSMARQRRATQRTAQQTRTGLTNIQSGLVQLSTWLLNVNVKINNVFANMKTRFTEAETAMTQLKIVMGLSGKTAATSGAEFQRFAEASSQIDLLARTTQFTKREVADAFTALITSGRTVDEAAKMISSTLQFATASGGMLNLTESVDLATLTIGTLGGSVEDVDTNLNMLLKTTQNTKIQFKDLRQVLQSMRSAYTRFSETTGVSREAELIATAAALRTLGISAGNSGQVVDQFSRALNTMYNALNKAQMMDRASGGSRGKRPRFSYKREALAELFLTGLDVKELQKELNSKETDIRRLQDEFMKRQLYRYDKSGQRASPRSMSDFLTRLVAAYSRVAQESGKQAADALMQSALGTAGASTLVKSIISLAESSGKGIDQAAEHYKALVKALQTNQKEMVKADEEAKTTIAYRTKVLDSAIAALSNTIFEQDLVAISALDTYKEMVSSTNTLMKNNKDLASSVSLLGRGFQLLTGFGTNVGFALVAAATFSTALTYSLNGATVAATGLGATLGAFSRTFLMPTLVVVGQLTLALGALGLSIVALVNYFSGGMGVANGFKVMLDNIKFAAMSAGGMMNLVFSKDFGSRNVKTLVKDYYKASDAMADIERKLDQLYNKSGGNLTRQERESVFQLTQEYDRLGAKMSTIKGVLGESGYVGLDALGARGASNLAVTFAGLIQTAKELYRALKIVIEGALVPLTLVMDTAYILGYTVAQVLLIPFRALAAVFGLVDDGAGLVYMALTALGYVLGTLIGYRIVAFMFRTIGSAAQGVVGQVTRLRDGMVRYSTNAVNNLDRVNRSVINATHYQQRQVSVIERAELAYAALSNSQQRLTNAEIRFRQGITLTGQAIEAQRTRLQTLGTTIRGYFNRVSSGIAVVGGAVASIGGLMMMSGNETTAAFGQSLMMLGSLASVAVMVATQVFPLLASAFAFVAGTALGMAGAIALATAGISILIAGVATLYRSYNKPKQSYFSQGTASDVGQTMITGGGSGGTASFGSVTPTTSGMSTSTGGTAQFQTVASPSTTKVINNQPNQNVVNIEKVTVNANGTTDGLRTAFVKLADNRPKQSGATSFARQD